MTDQTDTQPTAPQEQGGQLAKLTDTAVDHQGAIDLVPLRFVYTVMAAPADADKILTNLRDMLGEVDRLPDPPTPTPADQAKRDAYGNLHTVGPVGAPTTDAYGNPYHSGQPAAAAPSIPIRKGKHPLDGSTHDNYGNPWNKGNS